MKMKSPTVFITNDGGHDFNSASSYGKLVPLTQGNLNPFHTDRLVKEITPILAASTSEDYLLLCGHPVLVAISTLLFSQNKSEINLLLWDALQRKYKPRRIKVSGYYSSSSSNPTQA